MKTIKIEIPALEEFEKIKIRLEKPRKINYRWKNPPKTYWVENLDKHRGRQGIYLIPKQGKIIYVGSTTDLERRIRGHWLIKQNKDINFIYFLEEKDRNKRLFFEQCYKFHFFGKVKPEPFR